MKTNESTYVQRCAQIWCRNIRKWFLPSVGTWRTKSRFEFSIESRYCYWHGTWRSWIGRRKSPYRHRDGKRLGIRWLEYNWYWPHHRTSGPKKYYVIRGKKKFCQVLLVFQNFLVGIKHHEHLTLLDVNFWKYQTENVFPDYIINNATYSSKFLLNSRD